MHFSILFASSLAILPALVSGHSDIPGAPKVFGRRTLAELKARNVFASSSKSDRTAPVEPRGVEERQSTTTCGAGIGSCAAGLCCSGAGYCGTGKDYCAAPDCQFNYGPACDANTVPSGASTSSVSRPQLGSVPYGGAGIYDCNVPGTIAITFDDGPYIYTSGVLDLFKQYNAKATFFITGNNLGKGEIDNAAYPWVSIIQRMYSEGHQIASHTWSHQDLSALTSAQRRQQMYSNEIALRNILGFFPTYMRPPYSSCNDACESDLEALGYHITYFDLDTEDYLHDSPTEIQVAKNNFVGNISTTTPANGDWLVIGHDIHEQTAHNLTAYMLQTLLSQGYKPVTVGECLGDPSANWYRSSSGSVFTSSPSSTVASPNSVSSSAPVQSPTAVSMDATCGGSSGYTCLGSSFGNCCSVNGWCGSASAYCGTGCQSAFGNCGSNNPSGTSSATAPVSTVSRTVSIDGNCGGTSGQTCQGSTFGNCCSQYGYCGSTTDYCQNGCQTAFGTCGVNNSSPNANFSSSSVSSVSPSPISYNTTSSSPTAVVLTPSLVGTTSWNGSSSSVPANTNLVSLSSSYFTTFSAFTESSETSYSSSFSSSFAVPVSTLSTSMVPTSTMSSSTSSIPGQANSSLSLSSSSSVSANASFSVSSSALPSSQSPAVSPTTSSSSRPQPTLATSHNGKCGAVTDMTCKGSRFGACCGADNRCGNFFECLRGCQKGYGSCVR